MFIDAILMFSTKKQAAVLIALCSCISLFSQSVESSSGDSYITDLGSLDFTVGEVVIYTGTLGTTTFTQGFHQSSWYFSEIYDHNSQFEALLFPNPTIDLININTSDFAEVRYTLHDAAGRIVFQGQLFSETTSLDLSEFASGTYSITLSRSGENLKIFKLIKLY